MVKSVKGECPWCKFQKEGFCKVDGCDFKTLPYEKKAILVRIKQVSGEIDVLHESLFSRSVKRDPEKVLFEMFDLQLGMAIMADRLMKDFDMSLDEIKREASFKKFSFTDKARLLSLTNEIKRSQSRRDKHGDKGDN